MARQGRLTDADTLALLDLAADAIFARDVEGRIIYWSRGAESFYGWTTEEALGRKSDELLGTEFPGTEAAAVAALRSTDEWSGRLAQCRKDGSRVTVEGRWTLQRDEHGAPTAYLEVNRDITERLKVEQLLEEQRRALARSNAELEQFAYVASHDLQEPLRKVAAFCALLERKYRGRLDADADQYIAYAVDGARRMQQLINDLLDYSRLSRGTTTAVAVDPHMALARALRNLETAVEETDAVIDVDALPRVSTDPTHLVQLFQNLVGNAVKFRSPERKPRIEVGGVREGDWCRLWVKDNGIGIDPEYADRVFQVFQRLHTKEQYPGTGIGLAICQRIVERSGGRMWLESTPAVGSAFVWTMPAPPGG